MLGGLSCEGVVLIGGCNILKSFEKVAVIVILMWYMWNV